MAFLVSTSSRRAVKITDDRVTISLKNASIVDQFLSWRSGGNLGIAEVPATLSFDITYSKSGGSRHVAPTSTDPLSPFDWEGEMREAMNSENFRLLTTGPSRRREGLTLRETAAKWDLS